MPTLPAILWRGPSQLDGKPIMLVATHNSQNPKTGDIVQTWILRDDIAPHHAIHTGDDASVCGSCPLRGEIVDGRTTHRACYVQTHNAPRSIFAKHTRGGYAELSITQAREALAGRVVRLGAYGDPAAVPIAVWDRIMRDTVAHTGYTHQWQRFSAIARYCMASVESETQADKAHARGFRTFRVGLGRTKTEAVCPASHEAGRKLNCAQCLACSGRTSRRTANIVIAPHGNGAKYVTAA